MLPRRLEADRDRQRQLIALFVLARRPHLAAKVQSLTSTYSDVSGADADTVWKERLVQVAKDTSNPVDLAEVLKTVLRRLDVGARPIIDPSVYVRFVQQEHAASYPRSAYSTMLIPQLSSDVAGLLDAVFEVCNAIALHAETNAMSAGRLCHLFGWWLLGAVPDGATGWNDLYEAYKLAGQRAEHLFYTHIRWQSTQQKMPRRLIQLILSYPFGESSASSEHLPLPPASTFSRNVLHVALGTDSALPRGTDPEKVLNDALIAQLDGDAEAPQWLELRQKIGGSGSIELDDLLAASSLGFLGELAQSKGLNFTTPPTTPTRIPDEHHYHPLAGDSDRVFENRRRSQSYGDIPRLEVNGKGNTDSSLGAIAESPRTPAGKDHTLLRQSSAANLSPGSPARPEAWSDFEKLGFGDNSSKLNLNLTQPITPLRQPSPKLLAPQRKVVVRDQKPTTTFVISSEEIVAIDDAFIHFVEDGQLDPVASASWPRFALLRLNKPIPSEDEENPIDHLLVTVQKRVIKRPPSIDEPLPDFAAESRLERRAASPSGDSQVSRFSTFGLKDFANSFRRSSLYSSGGRPGSRMSFLASTAPSRSAVVKSSSLDPVTEKAARNMSKRVSTAASDTPTEYTVGEMGEIVMVSAEDNKLDDQAKKEARLTVAQTPVTDWKYLMEGGAHAVFVYKGHVPSLQGSALRIAKTLPPNAPSPELRKTWNDDLLPTLISSSLLARSTKVNVSKEWVQELAGLAEHLRPDQRKRDSGILASSIDTSRAPQIMTDLSAAEASAKTLVLEIKPKWGFLPLADDITPLESVEIKSRNCRYCLHENYRGATIEHGRYCPIDLYSGESDRVQRALDGLWKQWLESDGEKNNLRVFVDGNRIVPRDAHLIPTAGSGKESLGTGTFKLVAPLLESSGVLQQLKKLQQTLQAGDISKLAADYTAANPGKTLFADINEPTPTELEEFVALYSANPTDSSKWTLRQREIAFALSAIFKDSSIIVRSVLNPTGTGSYVLVPDKSAVKIIDTDLKPLSSLPKWAELDNKLWRHWAATHAPEVIVIDKHTPTPSESRHASPAASRVNVAQTSLAAGALGAGAVAGLAGIAAAQHHSPTPSKDFDTASVAGSLPEIDAATSALAKVVDASPSAKAKVDSPSSSPLATPSLIAAIGDSPRLGGSPRVDYPAVPTTPSKAPRAAPDALLASPVQLRTAQPEAKAAEPEPVVPVKEAAVEAPAAAPAAKEDVAAPVAAAAALAVAAAVAVPVAVKVAEPAPSEPEKAPVAEVPVVEAPAVEAPAVEPADVDVPAVKAVEVEAPVVEPVTKPAEVEAPVVDAPVVAEPVAAPTAAPAAVPAVVDITDEPAPAAVERIAAPIVGATAVEPPVIEKVAPQVESAPAAAPSTPPQAPKTLPVTPPRSPARDSPKAGKVAASVASLAAAAGAGAAIASRTTPDKAKTSSQTTTDESPSKVKKGGLRALLPGVVRKTSAKFEAANKAAEEKAPAVPKARKSSFTAPKTEEPATKTGLFGKKSRKASATAAGVAGAAVAAAAAAVVVDKSAKKMESPVEVPTIVEPVPAPVAEPAEPTAEAAVEPAAQSAVQPATERAVEPATAPAVAEPAAVKPVVAEASEPSVPEPVVADSVVAETSSEPVVAKIAASEPVTPEVATPAPVTSAAVVEPVAEPIPEPIAEPIAKGIAEAVAEPVTQHIAEPIVEPIPDPVAEPIAVAETLAAEPVPEEPIPVERVALAPPAPEKATTEPVTPEPEVVKVASDEIKSPEPTAAPAIVEVAPPADASVARVEPVQDAASSLSSKPSKSKKSKARAAAAAAVGATGIATAAVTAAFAADKSDKKETEAVTPPAVVEPAAAAPAPVTPIKEVERERRRSSVVPEALWLASPTKATFDDDAAEPQLTAKSSLEALSAPREAVETAPATPVPEVAATPAPLEPVVPVVDEHVAAPAAEDTEVPAEVAETAVPILPLAPVEDAEPVQVHPTHFKHYGPHSESVQAVIHPAPISSEVDTQPETAAEASPATVSSKVATEEPSASKVELAPIALVTGAAAAIGIPAAAAAVTTSEPLTSKAVEEPLDAPTPLSESVVVEAPATPTAATPETGVETPTAAPKGDTLAAAGASPSALDSPSVVAALATGTERAGPSGLPRPRTFGTSPDLAQVAGETLPSHAVDLGEHDPATIVAARNIVRTHDTEFLATDYDSAAEYASAPDTPSLSDAGLPRSGTPISSALPIRLSAFVDQLEADSAGSGLPVAASSSAPSVESLSTSAAAFVPSVSAPSFTPSASAPSFTPSASAASFVPKASAPSFVPGAVTSAAAGVAASVKDGKSDLSSLAHAATAGLSSDADPKTHTPSST